jgi:hypothetical protein
MKSEPANDDLEPEVTEDNFYEEEHRGQLILILGIASIILQFCTAFGVFAVVPWLMGSSDLAKMDAGTMDPAGRRDTRTGRMLGVIAFCIFCFQMVILMAYAGFIGVMIMLRR